jgi:hypothetical protein
MEIEISLKTKYFAGCQRHNSVSLRNDGSTMGGGGVHFLLLLLLLAPPLLLPPSLFHLPLLKRRGIDGVDTSCSMCLRMDDDVRNCFFKYKYVHKCLQMINLEGVMLKLVDLRNAKKVTSCILSVEEENKYKTMILMWPWWGERNKANAGEHRKIVQEVVHKARNMTYEVCTMLKKTVEKHHRKVHRWCPPTHEFLKVNIDGAFLMVRNPVDAGFIVGDVDGNVVMARARRLQLVYDTFCVETYTCLAALTDISYQGITGIQLEMESPNLGRPTTSVVPFRHPLPLST